MFRINDDSEVKTAKNFLSVFVDALGSFNPPYVGVVGPICKEGKTTILTHDFVHRTHMEVGAPTHLFLLAVTAADATYKLGGADFQSGVLSPGAIELVV